MVHDLLPRLKVEVGKPVLAHVLPDILGRVQLWALGRDRDQREVAKNIELGGGVPSCDPS